MTTPGGAETTSILRRVSFPSARFQVARAKQTSEETFGELIVQLAAILGVSADEILGLEASGRAHAAIRNRRLLRQVQQLERLPKRGQQALLRTIDAFLSKAG
jgi:hypothetical protein